MHRAACLHNVQLPADALFHDRYLLATLEKIQHLIGSHYLQQIRLSTSFSERRNSQCTAMMSFAFALPIT